MAQFEIKNLSFTYPLTKKQAIKNVDLNIEQGEYIVVCGKSGCGKTTLLRLLKPTIAPKGKIQGEILFNKKNIGSLELREQSQNIGFVMQNPDTQIVTDKVWHELAFGLENLGLKNDIINLKVAEMAAYFGISSWFDKNVNELSGGQKQLLNLASVMLMNPQVLILDEPTSQLDPIAAENFLNAVDKINKELGVTVIICEHRLEEVFPQADRVVVMDNGEIISDCSPREIGKDLRNQPALIQLSAPAAMKVFAETGGIGLCPLTVREGRKWLKDNIKQFKNITRIESQIKKDYAVSLKNICFAYGKHEKDIIKNLSLDIPNGSIFALLGANAAGKSTLIKIMSGILKPYNGGIKIDGKKIEKYKGNSLYKNNLAVLPQAVQTLFTANTVAAELADADKSDIDRICKLTQIEDILSSHPFDISGGEQQRAALAKVLLTNPKILIADEPTKGMDGEYKLEFAKILKELKNQGCTVIIVSHDVEFCAEHADFCAMLFDGRIAAAKPAHSFFDQNRFYTTSASRMANGIINGAVTKEDIVECLKDA